MPYANTRELKEDVLFRSGETTNGMSAWEVKSVEYLNRVYKMLSTGASEFLPEYIDDWWWIQREGVFLLEPPFATGTVAVTEGSTSITFSSAPPNSLEGYRLKVDGDIDVPIIASHTGGVPTATLDANWTGETNSAAAFKAMKTEYSLPTTVQALLSPIVVHKAPTQIIGISPEAMDEKWPIGLLDTGIPQAFTLINDQTVRFSHGGDRRGLHHRLEYRYRLQIADLTDSELSIPLVPEQYRHILADMALTYVLIDKNDDRSNAVALAARTNLAAMIKDNRRRNTKIDTRSGHIKSRPLNGRLFTRGT